MYVASPRLLEACWLLIRQHFCCIQLTNNANDPRTFPALQLDIKDNPLNQKAVLSTMSSIMPDIMLFMATVSVGWLVWSFWYRVLPAKSLPGIPLVEFDGDNSRERYTSDIASLIGKGYENSSLSPLCDSVINGGIKLTAYKTWPTVLRTGLLES